MQCVLAQIGTDQRPGPIQKKSWGPKRDATARIPGGSGCHDRQTDAFGLELRGHFGESKQDFSPSDRNAASAAPFLPSPQRGPVWRCRLSLLLPSANKIKAMTGVPEKPWLLSTTKLCKVGSTMARRPVGTLPQSLVAEPLRPSPIAGGYQATYRQTLVFSLLGQAWP